MPVTDEVEQMSISRNGLQITVVDTPGLEEASSFQNFKEEIDQLLSTNKSRNVIYLITIKIGRYTKEERQILNCIFKKRRAMMRNAMIIFTNRNELMDEDDSADRNVDAWIEKNPNLLKFINDNTLKYLAFENKQLIEEENNLQVKDLLSVVHGVDKKDGIRPVSGHRNMENKIYVDKETIWKEFGRRGLEFFEEQKKIQYNM